MKRLSKEWIFSKNLPKTRNQQEVLRIEEADGGFTLTAEHEPTVSAEDVSTLVTDLTEWLKE